MMQNQIYAIFGREQAKVDVEDENEKPNKVE